MGKQIRVLRLLEYVYDDVALMETDQGHWQVPANGVYRPHSRQTIRSATLPLETVDALPPTPTEIEQRQWLVEFFRGVPGVIASDPHLWADKVLRVMRGRGE